MFINNKNETLNTMEDPIYELILDPINKQIFLNPYITECGHSFEKDSIEKICKSDKPICPTCKKDISINNIRENLLIKNIISKLIEQNPYLKKQQYFPIDTFIDALNNDEDNAIEILNSHPHLLNNIVHQGRNSLHIAIETNQIDLVRSLLEFEEIDINIPTEPPHPHPGSTPCDLAASLANQKILDILISDGAEYSPNNNLLTPLQVAQYAAETNNNHILLRTIKNMVEVFLSNKHNKKKKKSQPKSTRILLKKLSKAIQNKDHDELNNLLNIKPLNNGLANQNIKAENSEDKYGDVPEDNKSRQIKIIEKIKGHIETDDIQKAAEILSNNYYQHGSSKEFIKVLEIVQNTFDDQYEQICSSLLVEMIPNAKEGDTELLLKLFGPNLMSTPNFFDILDKSSSIN